jgi:predicted DsbA family dithiol-disulfide isomerase
VKVEIWSDVVCPWCYIGKRRFEKALEVLREKGVTDPVEVVWRSFQLDPRAPVGSPSPAIDAYARKFGGPDAAVRIIENVTNVAAADGIEFRMDIALRANTLLAHRALHWALIGHGAPAQTLLKERFLRAYFTDGLDVGDAGVLARCAEEVGLDGHALQTWLEAGGGSEAVADDLRAAAEREIDAVPSFVIDGRYLVPGAQDVDVFVNVLQRVLSR